MSYSIYLRYFLPVDEVRSASSGLTIAREYFPLEDEGRRVHEAEVGDIIQVKLTIIAPSDLHYLVVEDPLPAGCEDAGRQPEDDQRRGPEAAPGGPDRGKRLPDVAILGDDAARREGGALRQLPASGDLRVHVSHQGRGGREFRVIPSQAYEMYFPEVFGHSDGSIFTVR